jgi:hypothetical protein
VSVKEARDGWGGDVDQKLSSVAVQGQECACEHARACLSLWQAVWP